MSSAIDGRKIEARKPSNRGTHEGPEGSLINYDKFELVRGGYATLSLCGQCREEGRDDWKYRRGISKWSGLCRPHARMRRGDVRHPSGAVVHRSERLLEPGWRKRPMKVKFTCANRENGLHKGEVYLSSTEQDGKPRLEWQGLCSECQSLVPVHNKITEDVIRGGVKICFSRADGQGIPVIYSVCQHTRVVPRERASVYNSDPPIRGVCSECIRSPAALAERLAELARQSEVSSGSGPHSGHAKKRSVGRPRRTPETDRQKLATLLSRIHEAVNQFKREGKRRGDTTANEVAKNLGIGSQERGGTAMMQRASEWGLHTDWQTLRDFFWDGGDPSEVNFYSGE